MTKTMSFLLLGLIAAVPAFADETSYKGDPYSLDVCAVAGEKLGSMGEPIQLIHEGREIKFCCAGCNPRFKADPARYIAGVDQKMIDMQKKHYPLTTDVVSGKELPAEGAIEIIFLNRLFRLADSSSVAKLRAKPEEYFAKLDEAVVAAQTEDYPFDKCLVSGDDNGAAPQTLVVANVLFEICCGHCAAPIKKNPAKYIAMVESGELGEPEEIAHH
jgi:YHS domain-containing protein